MIETVWLAAPHAELKSEIEGIVGELQWLLPPWVQTLYLRYVDRPGEDQIGWLASVDTAYRYRSVTLSIYPKWVADSHDEKIKTIIHEFVHAQNAVIVDYAAGLIERFADDNTTLRNVVRDELDERSESATEDLATVIYRRLYSV